MLVKAEGATTYGCRMEMLHLRSPRRIAFARLILAGVGGVLALGASYAIVPPLVKGELGGTDVIVGWTITVFAVAALLARFGAGFGIDRRGARLVYAVGFGFIALGGALFFVAQNDSVLYVARALQGVGQACMFTAGLTWAVYLAPVHRRGQAISLFGLSVWAGLSLGPVVAQLLIDHVGLWAAEWLLVLAPMLALVSMLGMLGPPVHPESAGISFPREAFRPGLGLMFGGVVMAAIVGFAVLTFDFRDGGGGAYVIGAYGAATFIGRIVLGHLPDRLGSYRTGVLAFIFALIGISIIGIAPTWWLACVGAVICGAAWSLLFPALALMAIDRTSAHRRGAALAVYTAGFDLGFAAAGPLMGNVANTSGYGAVYAVAALFALGGLVLILFSRSAATAAATDPELNS